MVNTEKLDDIMLRLGYPESLIGTHYIRRAVLAYRPGAAMCKEIYPAIANAVESTPARVERAIRHATQTAWGRGSVSAQEQFFGYSVNPETGMPTNGELVARLARVCDED